MLDLESKKKTWDDLKIPTSIREGLEDLSMYKPSIIQAQSIPLINDNPQKNYMFQAINGSGKTLSFGLPSLLRVDPNNPNIQVVILANTRELNRQIVQVLQRVTTRVTPKITILVGDS